MAAKITGLASLVLCFVGPTEKRDMLGEQKASWLTSSAGWRKPARWWQVTYWKKCDTTEWLAYRSAQIKMENMWNTNNKMAHFHTMPKYMEHPVEGKSSILNWRFWHCLFGALGLNFIFHSWNQEIHPWYMQVQFYVASTCSGVILVILTQPHTKFGSLLLCNSIIKVIHIPWFTFYARILQYNGSCICNLLCFGKF